MLLNVGSGQRRFGTPECPWVNVDINPRWNPDIVADGATMNMDSDSAEVIVLHHTLEHYGCGEADMLIRNCHRILKPGGSLLVFVPDMDALARAWIAGKIPTQVYMTSVYGAFMDSDADRHRWGFTRLTLGEFLTQCRNPSRDLPWSDLRLFDGRLIPGADIAQDWWILGVEAIK